MKNRYLDKFDKIVKVRIVGSNINNYMERVIRNNISIIRQYPVSYREVYLVLKYSDYLNLVKYKSIYQISIVERMGKLRVIDYIKNNYILFVFIFLGILLIVFLSNFIFSIEVIHYDKEIRELVRDELYRHNIYRCSFKKSYGELEKIENDILSSNKDRLEWIEIIESGTKYIVRVEERKINKNNNEDTYQNIVSRKNAVIVRIDADSGEIVKNVNDFVREGEVIISGNVSLPNNSFVKSTAKGLVYGEVWYQVDMKYPFVYQESSYTGKKRCVYVINFFGREVGLFQFNKYNSFDRNNKVIFCSNFLNVCFIKQRQYEVNVKDEIYTFDVVRYKALEYIKDKMFKDNSNIKEIKDVKVIYSDSDDVGVRFKLFVRVVEDIGKVLK